MSKLISKMPETHFQKSKTHFQKAETHFHRILLEWTWVEFGQKKACIDTIIRKLLILITKKFYISFEHTDGRLAQSVSFNELRSD